MTRSPYAGIYPPIATPFDDNGEVSVAGLQYNLARWAKADLAGLVVLGSNGEFPYLDDYERDMIISTVVESAPSCLRVIVGTARESTRATIRATLRAAELGAHAAIVVNPSYYVGRMTDPVLHEHYVAVADASPIPILLYNVPSFTGVNLSSQLVARLAEHANIVGVKDTSANIVQIADIVRLTPSDFAVLAGSASFLLPSLAVGAQGGILAIANFAPQECVELERLYAAGRMEEAQTLHHRLIAPNAAVTTRFGQAGLKIAMELRGYYGGLPRRPLLPLSAADREEVVSVLRSAKLL